MACLVMPARLASSVRLQPGQRQVARDLDVRCAQRAPGGQIGQGQRQVGIVGHQGQHPGIEALAGHGQQAAQVGLAPGFRSRGCGHPEMVNQID
jgi:hypothetical protein